MDNLEIKNTITAIVKERDFSEKVVMSFSRGSGKGDGYMSEIVRIHVFDEKTQNAMHLIAKVSIKDEKIRRTMPVADSFEREVHAYANIFPVYRKLQEKAKIQKPFDAVPKIYAFSMTENEEYIILEDLKHLGFEMNNIKKLLDHEHIEQIFEKYAELHALSFAVKTLNPRLFLKLKSGLKFTFDKLITEGKVGDFFLKTWEFTRNAMKEEGYRYELLDEYAENCLVMMKIMTNPGENNFSSILHGDCWMNNFMFKYKEGHNGKKQLNELKILDWQACHVGSPVFDLSYLIYSSASKSVFDNLKRYMKIYHESLSNFLSEFDLDVNSIYPFEEFQRQWKSYCHFGAIMSGPIWKVRSFEENQVIDHLNDSSDEDTIYLDKISIAECDKNYLVENMKILFDHLENITK